MLEIFFKISDTLIEMRDLMISMNKHLSNLTIPPNMVQWAETRKYWKQIYDFEEAYKKK